MQRYQLPTLYSRRKVVDRWQAVKLEAEGTPFWVVKDDGGQWELYHAAREAPESLHVSVSEAKRVVEEKLGCAVEWREMNWAKRLVKAYVRPHVFHKEHFWRCYADLDNGIRVEAGGVALLTKKPRKLLYVQATPYSRLYLFS